ncbi:2-dehydropantoate 2-reductase [Paenibacillus turicensis]|uniref:2-dehydropantoate 2-reductase n=1 Tax=Paenibacillus turicensis TaxID=160487 RepID=A0ABS4FP59_9BACL|nr:2-dehydropantoate 2-reductase [Paenibacillus turicensis]
MVFHIIGAGALGLLYGSKLCLAGHEVMFSTRTEEQAICLNSEGITLHLHNHDMKTHITPAHFQAFSMANCKLKPSTAATRAVDWLIITVKQWQVTADFIKQIENMAHRNTNILCLQNGIGLADFLIDSNIGQAVFSAVTTEGAKRSQCNEVFHTGSGNTMIGITKKGTTQTISCDDIKKNGENLTDIFQKAGFRSFLSNKIDIEIYKKLLINCIINPLTAIWRIPNGELIANADRIKLVQQLCQEAELICQASGIHIDFDLYDQVVQVCKGTSSNTSSMLKDVLQGNQTEIDYINGHLVKLALAANIEAPMHSTITHLIKGINSF